MPVARNSNAVNRCIVVNDDHCMVRPCLKNNLKHWRHSKWDEARSWLLTVRTNRYGGPVYHEVVENMF